VTTLRRSVATAEETAPAARIEGDKGGAPETGLLDRFPDGSYRAVMNNTARKAAPHRPHADEVVFSLLGRAGEVEARLEAALEPVGLSLAKAALLHHLAEVGEPIALSDLAEQQHCVRSNITQLIDGLEKDGLVRRRADPEDRRSVRAALTPAGERVYEKARQLLAEEQKKIVSALSAGDLAGLRTALAALGR
jgi:DNA-binding MarR family transcriptional regulator